MSIFNIFNINRKNNITKNSFENTSNQINKIEKEIYKYFIFKYNQINDLNLKIIKFKNNNNNIEKHFKNIHLFNLILTKNKNYSRELIIAFNNKDLCFSILNSNYPQLLNLIKNSIKIKKDLLNSIHTIVSITNEKINPKVKNEKYFENENIYLKEISKKLEIIQSNIQLKEIKLKIETYLLENINLIKNNEKYIFKFIKSLNIEYEKTINYSNKIA